MFLWINLPDALECGEVPPLGHVVLLLISYHLGDRLLDGAIRSYKNVDDVFIVVETSQARADVLIPALVLIGERKIGRKIRTRTTKTEPRCPPWIWTSPLGEFGLTSVDWLSSVY